MYLIWAEASVQTKLFVVLDGFDFLWGNHVRPVSAQRATIGSLARHLSLPHEYLITTRDQENFLGVITEEHAGRIEAQLVCKLRHARNAAHGFGVASPNKEVARGEYAH